MAYSLVRSFWSYACMRHVREMGVAVFLVTVLAAWCAYKGYKAGYRNGLIYSSMWHQEHWPICS